MSNSHATPEHSGDTSPSALGLAGLIFSILGWFTLGVLWPVGIILCLLDLANSKKGKGYAIAGLIVAFPVFIALAIALAFVIYVLFALLITSQPRTKIPDSDKSDEQAIEEFQSQYDSWHLESPEYPVARPDVPGASKEESFNPSLDDLGNARQVENENERRTEAALKAYEESQYREFVAQNPEPVEPLPEYRTWIVAGEAIEAKFISVIGNGVKLQKRDLSFVTVFHDELSREDKDYILGFKKSRRQFSAALQDWQQQAETYKSYRTK